MTDTMNRADAPQRATWNHEAVFSDWDAFTSELNDLEKLAPKLREFEGRLTESAATLREWLRVSDNVSNRLGRALTYATMASSVDSTDSTAKAMDGKAMSVFSALAGATGFAEPELIAALTRESGLIETWIAEAPTLGEYEPYFRALIAKAPYRLSGEVETVLGNLSSALAAAPQTLNELASSDLRFPDACDSTGARHRVTQGTFGTHYSQEDRELRRTTWESFGDTYRAFQNTFAAGYLGVIKRSVFEAKTRGYDSVLHERLEPTGLPTQTFHLLIETFVENLPVWHRYWDVKRRLLGIDTMRPWDRWAPIAKNGPAVPYETAVEWIGTALSPMGDEYVDTLRRGALDERWVDWAPNTGKRQGAFSVAAYPNTYPFIMMTYTDTIGSMSTLAHELGHSMHHYLTAQNQPAVYNGLAGVWRSSSIAETASNFHQAMTRTWLRREKGADEALMLAVIDEAMTNYHRYCFIMPTLARFELEVTRRAEAGEPLNAPILNEIMAGYFAEGYGESLVDDPQRSGITWAQFQHLYRPFYTFQYAIGISAASIAADRIYGDGSAPPDTGAVNRFVEMLKSGYRFPAIETFGIAGIDMTSKAPMESMFGRLASLVEQLEAMV